MNKSMMKYIIALMLTVTGSIYANTVWNPLAGNITDGTANWGVSENWASGLPGLGTEDPPLDNKAVFNSVGAATECIVSDAQICKDLVAGDGSAAGILRIVDGGDLTTTGDWMAIGYNAPATLIVEKGGVCHFNSHLWWGLQGGAKDSLVEINGGTVISTEAIDLGREGGACTVIINEGLLQARYFPDDYDSENSVINIKYGAFATTNDYANEPSKLWNRINAGTIVGFGGQGTLNVERVDGLTLVTAKNPMNIVPEYKETVTAGPVDLKWTNILDPNDSTDPLYVDVWFASEPNEFVEPVYELVVEGMETAKDMTNSIEVNADGQICYWRVDTYTYGSPTATESEPMVEGDTFVFYTKADIEPEVEILTPDTLTWAGEGVQLDAEITDLGIEFSTVHIEWSVPEDIAANVTFSPSANAEDPVIVGDMHLPNTTVTCTVWDEANGVELASSDTVVIDIAEDACQGARGGFPRRDLIYLGDYDGNCVIDIYDFAMVAVQWLDPYQMTEPIEIVPAAGVEVEEPVVE